MEATEEPSQSSVRGCVQRLGLPQGLAMFLETLRIRDKKPNIEAVLREAMYDLAEAHGIVVPREEPSDEHRQKIAALGQLDHGNISSTMSKRAITKKQGRVYVELILYYNGEEKWPARLLEKLQCNWPTMILRAVNAYQERRSSH